MGPRIRGLVLFCFEEWKELLMRRSQVFTEFLIWRGFGISYGNGAVTASVKVRI